MNILDTFWTGDIGRKVGEAGLDAQLLALYLMTNPKANQVGLYYFQFEELVRHTKMDFTRAKNAMKELRNLGFCSFDGASGMVFIKDFLYMQKVHEMENPLKFINQQLNHYVSKNPIVREFMLYYRDIVEPSPAHKNNQDEFNRFCAQINTEIYAAGLANCVEKMIGSHQAVVGIKKMIETGITTKEAVSALRYIVKKGKEAERPEDFVNHPVTFIRVYFSANKRKQAIANMNLKVVSNEKSET